MPLTRKTAFIDLSTRQVEVQEVPSGLRRDYLGGRGLNMYYLKHLTPRGADPFDARNPLIFGAGLLTGVLGGRSNVSGRSPESGYLGDSNVGGYFGAELAGTGYSHLVITGKSDRPVYLYIENEKISFMDAAHLWGRNTAETQTMISDELGDDRVKTMCIGPAGENKVRFACIITGPKNAAGRTGLGALMGSKQLKAVAVRGNRPFSIEDPTGYIDLLRATSQKTAGSKWGKALGLYGTPILFKNANTRGWTSYRYHQRTTVGELGEPLHAENLYSKMSKGSVSCFGCPIHCRHRFEIKEGKFKGTRGEGPEYASIASLGPTLGNLNLESVVYLSELCNQYGIDTISGGNYLGYAFTLFEKGIISREDVGYALQWGDHDAIERLMTDTVYRRNFGNVVAEGSFAPARLSPEAGKHMMTIKNVSIEMTDERAAKAFGFGLAVATRGTCHMRSRPSTDVVQYPRELLNNFYGADVGEDFKDYRGKARMVWWHELFNAVMDSVGICRFAGVFSSINALGYLDICELLKKTVGFDLTDKDLYALGERIYTTERLFINGEGISRKDDTLPDLYYDAPVPDGPTQGEHIDREKFEEMLDDYYQLHGWDSNGVPTPATVNRLRIDESFQEEYRHAG
ncbi:aldehyde ferredoxin oxidoreductase family protein [Desulforhabdus sp. TSK]|uniref:aldehyde ferredoxin oxidoreductase family protein n=1 Tax=Desulforhabdus sp. TSK TaxID=2925014 RepID=UPI001FC7CAAC|nr:aldehyde ferredoxin oxidoreductase family protein [Desulforhabdus sp. TSK]GKT06938.1 aldehyde ferredoxin oxidoreductase [Desulforhabdus sp. TSK]